MKRIYVYGGLVISALLTVAFVMKARQADTAASLEKVLPDTHRARPQPADSRDFKTRFHEVASGTDRIRRDAGLSEISRRWITANPGEALDFARRLPDGETKTTFRRQLLVAWAERDAAAAMAWTDWLSENPERRDARAMIATALATSDPRSALELAIQHGADEDETGGLLENLAMQWAERETDTALEWVSAQPNREWHDRLIARVSYVLSKSDPHTAACHVAEDMEPGPMQDEAVVSVLHQWLMIDSEAASRWVESFTEGALRERALGELACWDEGKDSKAH